jgi:hypothetical protein
MMHACLIVAYVRVLYQVTKLREEVEPGKQSGVTDPGRPRRAVEARPQKRTNTTQ